MQLNVCDWQGYAIRQARLCPIISNRHRGEGQSGFYAAGCGLPENFLFGEISEARKLNAEAAETRPEVGTLPTTGRC